MPETTRPTATTSIVPDGDEAIVLFLYGSGRWQQEERHTEELSFGEGSHRFVRVLDETGETVTDLRKHQHAVQRTKAGVHEFFAATWEHDALDRPSCVGYARVSLSPGRVHPLKILTGRDTCKEPERTDYDRCLPPAPSRFTPRYDCSHVSIVPAGALDARLLGYFERVEPTGVKHVRLEAPANRARILGLGRKRSGGAPRWSRGPYDLTPPTFTSIQIAADPDGTGIRVNPIADDE